jgi:hypothetical protein
MSDKTVPVYVNETPVENTTILIFQMNGRWTVNTLDAARLLSTLKSTVNPEINRFSVYEDKVVFTTGA